MTNDALLALALQAIDNADARLVLEDALQEFGPSVTFDMWSDRSGATLCITVDIASYKWEVERAAFGEPGSELPRALAAVLLFREWSGEPWPVWRAARRKSLLLTARDIATRYGYGHAEIMMGSPQLGLVQFHFLARVPAAVLSAIEEGLREQLPVYQALMVTALGDPRNDLELGVDGAVSPRFIG